MPSDGYDKRKELVSDLEEHYSRDWLFEAMKRKHQIKFKFKKNKSQINGRVYLEDGEIRYSIHDKEYSFGYLEETPVERDFLNAFWSFYPHNVDGHRHLEEWLSEWLKDKRKRNKPYRQLIGDED